jgi:hypothetical protein
MSALESATSQSRAKLVRVGYDPSGKDLTHSMKSSRHQNSARMSRRPVSQSSGSSPGRYRAMTQTGLNDMATSSSQQSAPVPSAA